MPDEPEQPDEAEQPDEVALPRLEQAGLPRAEPGELEPAEPEPATPEPEPVELGTSEPELEPVELEPVELVPATPEPELGTSEPEPELEPEPEPAPTEPELEPAPAEKRALVELSLSEVRASVTLRPGQEAGLVVLAEMEEPFRALHIYVGQPEARAIQAGWHGGPPARPGTWDLFLQTVELLGGRLDRAVIDRVEEARHFFALLEFEHAGETLSLECRPSDAVALAVRAAAAGLFTTEEVLAAAGRYP